MKTLKLIFLGMIFLTLCQTSYSQQNFVTEPKCILKGVLVDAEDSSPLEFANVVLYALNNSTIVTWSISKNDGAFELSKIGLGEYDLAITVLGYEELKMKNVVFNKQGFTLDLGKINLNKATTALDEVSVVGIQKTYQTKIDKKVINVSKDINSTGGTAIDLIKNVPGLAVDADGVVNLRGNSGVSILIDGRPTSIDATKLDQIPAADIESLEIITNPSAKYNPEGKSGIINIKLKQSKTVGFSGNAMVTAGTGDKYNESVNLNYNMGKVNLFASYSGIKRMAEASRYLLRESYDSDAIHFLQQDAKTNIDITKNTFTLGSNFNLNSQNKLTLSYTYKPSKTIDDDQTLSQYFDRSMNKTGSVFVINSENGKETANDYLVAYRKLFDKKGEELTVDYTLSSSSGSAIQPLTYQYSTKTETSEINTNSDIYNSNLQVNWVLPFDNGSKLETGIHSIVRGNDSEYYFFNSSGGTKVEDLSQRNLFTYNEQIHAGYGLWSGKFGGTSVQAGLRIEKTYVDGKQGAGNDKISQDYFNLYPSLSFSHPINENNQLQLSYSRTIKRPSARMINPFVDRSNLEVFRSGNPDLKPEYVNSIELGFDGNYDKTILGFTAFYKHIANPINTVILLDEAGISHMAPQNMLSSLNYGLEFTFEQALNKWWKINGNSSFFKNEITGNVDGNSASNYSYLGSFNSICTPSKGLSFQLIANYAGPIVGVYSRMEPQFSMDCAVRKDLLKNKLSLTLRASDVFNSLKNSYTAWGSNFTADNWRKTETRVLYFSISYSFGSNGNSKSSKSIIQNESKPSTEI